MSVSVNKRNGEIESIHLHGKEALNLAIIMRLLKSGFHETLKIDLSANNTMREVVELIAKEI